MAAESQSYEPEKLTAGMTWKWNKTISDYPATEWTLTYYLRINGSTAPRKKLSRKGLLKLCLSQPAPSKGKSRNTSSKKSCC